jgi:hypothetical protein
MQEQMEPAKQALDVISFGTAIGALAGWLPAIAAVFTIVWTGIRIYESKTVQKLLGRGRG